MNNIEFHTFQRKNKNERISSFLLERFILTEHNKDGGYNVEISLPTHIGGLESYNKFINSDIFKECKEKYNWKVINIRGIMMLILEWYAEILFKKDTSEIIEFIKKMVKFRFDIYNFMHQSKKNKIIY